MNIRFVVLFVLLTGIATEAADEVRIKTGQTIKEAIAILGEPDGTVVMGKDSYLYYAGMTIQITEEVVSDLPENFSDRLRITREKESEKSQFVRDQREKGLVYYDGEWMTKDKKDDLIRLAAQQEKMRQEVQKARDWAEEQSKLNLTVRRKDGTKVDHDLLTIEGKVSVVIFIGEREQLPFFTRRDFRKLDESDPYVVVRRVDLSSREDPVIEEFGVTKSSMIRVIDPEGRVVAGATKTPTPKQLREAVDQAKRQCRLGEYAKP